MEKRGRFKIAAISAKQVGLAPVAGNDIKGDFADVLGAVNPILINFEAAVDNKFFDVVGREYEVTIRRR